MKIRKILIVSVLVIFCCAGLSAQDADIDLSSVFKCLMSCIERMEKESYSNSYKGATADSSFSWEIDEDLEIGKMVFSSFSFYTVDYDGNPGSLIGFNGTLAVSAAGFSGTLKINGNDIAVSSVSFQNYGFWDAENGGSIGSITVDGEIYSSEKCRELAARADDEFNKVFTWESEVIYSCMLLFMLSQDLSWNDGEPVWDSIGNPDSLPAAETKMSNENDTLTAVAQKNGVEFNFNNYTIDLQEDNSLGMPFSVTGKTIIGAEFDADDHMESIFFNGSLRFKGLKIVSSLSFNDCKIVDSDDDNEVLKGHIAVNGRQYAFQNFMTAIRNL